MDLHQNARLTFRSREALAKKIMMERLTLNAAAAAFNVSRKTAAKWLGRYRALGLPGLRDRSSRPLHSPRRTSSELIAQVIALRRQLRPAYQIAQATHLSPATISRILRRAHLNRWRHLHPAPPVVRYEHPAPGDLQHLDIKGMTRYQQVSIRGDGRRRADAPSSPAGRLCTSPSTITPASPSPACCPTNKAKPPSPSCTPLSPSTPNTASPFADCSPTTAPAIAPATSALLASNSASSTASPALTRRAPTARQNASSKPPCASGLTFATTSTQKNEISSFPPGSSITTFTVRMVVSVTLRPSAARLRWVQRLDRSQAPTAV